jgi:hypothetical protein
MATLIKKTRVLSKHHGGFLKASFLSEEDSAGEKGLQGDRRECARDGAAEHCTVPTPHCGLSESIRLAAHWNLVPTAVKEEGKPQNNISPL